MPSSAYTGARRSCRFRSACRRVPASSSISSHVRVTGSSCRIFPASSAHRALTVSDSKSASSDAATASPVKALGHTVLATGVVMLIECHRHDQLRNPSCEPLRGSSNPAVMHQRRGPRQDATQRHVVEATDRFRQYVWEVLFVSGQEDAAPPQTLARLDGRFEETLSLTVG